MNHKYRACVRSENRTQDLGSKALALKARLHLQLSLRFLVQFSPFDGCERVNQSRMFKARQHELGTFVINPLVYICQKVKIATKIASVNEP